MDRPSDKYAYQKASSVYSALDMIASMVAAPLTIDTSAATSDATGLATMPPGEYKAPDVVLKEGNYDDVGVAKYSKNIAGDLYVAGGHVEALQLKLLEFGFYDLGGADGDFGAKTKDAVIQFQQTALQPSRQENQTLISVAELTYDGDASGTVDEKTWKEIEHWTNFGYRRPLESVLLSKQEKMKLVNIVAAIESGADAYWACNRDREFEGDFDKWGVAYSKYSDNPRHVGLSYGIIQFTQEGPLGILVNRMYAADPQKFEEIFGPKYQELIDTLNLKGDYRLVDEEITEKDGTKVTKKVKRKPSVEPIDGNELWESPWVDRFIEAGKVKVFQECQEALAVEEYLDVRLPFCRQQGIVTQPALANVFDRSVNEGWGQEEAKSKSGTPPSEKNITAFQKDNPLYNINSKEFWTKYADMRPAGIKSRIIKIADSDQVSWQKEYVI